MTEIEHMEAQLAKYEEWCVEKDRTIAALRAENERLRADATLGANLRVLLRGGWMEAYKTPNYGYIVRGMDRKANDFSTIDAALQAAADSVAR